MLTKFSALVPLALCTALLTARWLLDGRGSPTALLARLGTTLAVVLAIAGWHYARVALHFEGNPFVGNWDTATRYIWWQDPGYHVLADYTRFGAVLERPLMSSTASVLDALYATLFGDGLISGSGFPEVTPPWRLDWMALGYGVALVPCAVLLVGVALAFVDFVRQPRSERLLLVGVLGATGFLLLSLTLRLPYYAQAKAFYAMSALVPLAFCFALGFDALALRSRVLAPLGVTWLAGWIAVTLVTFAAPAERLRENPMVAVTQVDRGGFLAQANLAMAEGRRDEAIGALREALALDPDQARLGVALVKLLIAAGRPDEALAAARATLRVDPYDQSLHRIAAKLWREQGAQRRASRHLAWAERLGRVGVGH